MNKSLVFMVMFLGLGFSQLSLSVNVQSANASQTAIISGYFMDNQTAIQSANVLVGIENISTKITQTNSEGYYSTTFLIPEMKTGIYNFSAIGIFSSYSISNSTLKPIYGRTTMAMNISPSSLVFTNITRLAGQISLLNVVIQNTGINTAIGNYSFNFTNNTYNESFSLSPSARTSKIYTINVPENTAPTNLNIPINITWINDNSELSSLIYNFSAIILPNELLNISPTSWNISIASGFSQSRIFTIESLGNVNVSISHAISGLPNWFTFSMVPNSSELNVTINVPDNETNQNISGYIQLSNNSLPVYIQVKRPKLVWQPLEILQNITNQSYFEFPVNLTTTSLVKNVTLSCVVPTGWFCELSRQAIATLDSGEISEVKVRVNTSFVETVAKKEVSVIAREADASYPLKITFELVISSDMIAFPNAVIFLGAYQADGYYFVNSEEGLIWKPDFSDMSDVKPRITRVSPAMTWTAKLVLNMSEGINDVCVPYLVTFTDGEPVPYPLASGILTPIIGDVGQQIYEYYKFLKPGKCKAYIQISNQNMTSYIVVSGVPPEPTYPLTREEFNNQTGAVNDIIVSKIDDLVWGLIILGILAISGYLLKTIINKRHEFTPRYHEEIPKEEEEDLDG